MSTRGAFGVRIDGVDKIGYNHCDSYPEGLGRAVLRDARKLRRRRNDYFRVQARRLRLVDQQGPPPTREEIELLGQYVDLGVGGRSTSDWYCLTRLLQGELAATLKAGLMLDGRAFLDDSLFCEWAYIVNLDEWTFEVYEGFQRNRHERGRYATDRPTDGDYYPVALVKSWPLDGVPRNWANIVQPSEDES